MNKLIIEAQNPRYLRASVKFPHSVTIWGGMSSAGFMMVGLLFFIESKVNAVLEDTILEHFHLQTSFMEMPVFFSTCPQSQRYYQKFADCCITWLGWLINMSDDNSTEKLSRQDNVKRKMRNTPTQMQMN